MLEARLLCLDANLQAPALPELLPECSVRFALRSLYHDDTAMVESFILGC